MSRKFHGKTKHFLVTNLITEIFISSALRFGVSLRSKQPQLGNLYEKLLCLLSLEKLPKTNKNRATSCVRCLHYPGAFNLFNTFAMGDLLIVALTLSHRNHSSVGNRGKKQTKIGLTNKTFFFFRIRHSGFIERKSEKENFSFGIKRDVYAPSQHKLQRYYHIAVTAASIDTFLRFISKSFDHRDGEDK